MVWSGIKTRSSCLPSDRSNHWNMAPQFKLVHIPKWSVIFFRGFPRSEPRSLTRDRIRLLEEKPHRVSWKADGTRYMMLIAGKDQVNRLDFFCPRKHLSLKVPNVALRL